jgi:TP901 family phage tail tape measure protein
VAKFDIVAVFKVTGLAEINKSFKQVGNSARNVQQNLSKFGGDATRLVGNIAKAGAATGAALGAATARFSSFQSQFSDVITLLDESSFEGGPEALAEGIKGLETGVLNLRKETGETFGNLNKGLFDLISAGRPAAEAIDDLRTATELATAGATETSIAVDGITSVLGAYGEDAGSAGDISEKFFSAQKAGKTTIAELAGSVGLVASQANAAGISFNELLASVSAATVSGIRTKAAFTGLRGAIDNIQKPTARAEEEAKRLGIQFDAAALRSKGLIGVLDSVSQSTNFTEDSFVNLFGSVEARNFALALANDQFERSRDILGSVSDETQRAETFSDALAEKQSDLSYQTGQLVGTFDAIVTNIGRHLSPAFASLFGVIRDLLVEFQPEIEAFFQSIGDFLLGLAEKIRANLPAIIDSIRGFFTGIGEAVEEIKEIFANLGEGNLFSAIIESISILSEKLGISKGMIYLVIAAFAQLIGVLPLAVSGFRLISSAGLLIASTFHVLVVTLTRLVIPLLTRIGTLFLGLFSSSTKASVGVSLLGLATKALTISLRLLKLALMSIPFIGIAVAIGVLIDKTIGWGKAWETVSGVVSKVFNWIVDGLASFGKGILSAIELVAQMAAALVYLFNPELGVKMSNGIREAFSALSEWMKGLFTGVIDWIKNAFSSVSKWVKSLFSSAKKETDDVKKQLDEIGKKQKDLQRQAEQSDLILGTQAGSQAVISRADGGKVYGPGSSRSDSVLAKLSRGEYVIKADSVKKFGTSFFNAINSGVLPAIKGFADGGMVSAIDNALGGFAINPELSLQPAMAASPSKAGRPLNLILPGGEVVKTYTDEDTADRLQRNMRRAHIARSGNLPEWY